MKIILITLLCWMISLTNLHAQEAILTSGGNALGSGGSVSFSVGQVVYNTNTGTNVSVAQGVQQPFEISIVNGIKEASGINLNCDVYPNPTSDCINLRIENYKIENITYQLYDISGKLISYNRIESEETNIVMKNLVFATYFLKIIQGNNEIKIFKIIKN